MSAEVATQVREALERIERDSGIRVLLAIESGSRAWGFASPILITMSASSIATHATGTFRCSSRADATEMPLPGILNTSALDRANHCACSPSPIFH